MIRQPLWLLLLVFGACKHRIPEHLQPASARTPARAAKIETIDDLISELVRADPLGRAAAGLTPDDLADVTGAEPYVELLNAAAALRPGTVAPIQRLRALELEHPGTAIVALSRGARVREIESSFGGQRAVNEGTQQRIVSLLTPLSSTSTEAGLPYAPLHWQTRGVEPRRRTLIVADRWALLGWLSGPNIELQPVADALSTPPFDTLRQTPAAQLVLARAADREGPTEPGLVDLERAAKLLLADSVLDRNREQEEQAAVWADIGEELQSDRPRDALLARAETRLKEAAGADIAAAGALLALQARRIWGECQNDPCVGLDRVQGLSEAGRWDPRIDRLAQWLQLAALVEAIDGADVAQNTIRWQLATVDLVDALIGTGAEPPQALVLSQRTPNAATWLSLGRSVGVEQSTTWEETEVGLRAHAARLAADMRTAEADSAAKALLDRVIAAAKSRP
ncbi:MAG: hypothetical protein AB8H79_10915 [Myxococcota bacterium]